MDNSVPSENNFFSNIYDTKSISKSKNTNFTIGYSFRHVVLNGEYIRLKYPVSGRIIVDETLIFKSDSYNIILCGENMKELQAEFDEEISFIYDCYVNEDDSKMTKDAIALKYHIKRMVGK